MNGLRLILLWAIVAAFGPLFPHAVQAEPIVQKDETLTAPGNEISLRGFDGGGGPAHEAPGYTISFLLAPQGGARRYRSATTEISLGVYSGTPTGGSSEATRAAALLAGGANCGGPAGSLRLSNDILFGVGTNQAVCASFSKLMLPASLSNAVSVTHLRDKDWMVPASGPVSLPPPAYDESPARLIVSAPMGGWQPNSLYQLVIGTAAIDQSGSALPASTTVYFKTQADPAQSNSFTVAADTSTRLILSPGALVSAGTIDISTAAVRVSQGTLQTALNKLKTNAGLFSRVHALREVDFFDLAGQPSSVSFAAGTARLSIPYADADGDGFIDGAVPPARVAEAALYVLDEVNALWVKIPGSGPQGGVVAGAAPHLSLFAVITPQASSVDEAFAFPVPFRPNGPKAGTAAGETGTEAAGITFSNLPVPAFIEVVNVRGERVWKGEETSGAGRLAWDARSSSGHPVASGVYFFIVRNAAGQSKTGKLAIIR